MSIEQRQTLDAIVRQSAFNRTWAWFMESIRLDLGWASYVYAERA
jgi:hypothetical protein